MKQIKKVICLVMSILIFSSYTIDTYALGTTIKPDNQAISVVNELDLGEQINYIEEALSKMEYSIEQRIKDNIAFYQKLIK